MWRVFLVQCVVVGSSSTVLANTQEGNGAASRWSPHSLGRIMAQCLGGAEVWHCLGSEGERLLEAAARDNSSWQISDYLSIEPPAEPHGTARSDGGAESGLAGRLLQLVQGRALRVQLPRELTISNAIDDFGTQLGFDQGRKKKDKDKHMAMMGGMIMIATVAQMFLGKVILIAGAAFIMAKIALVISLLGSLKKGSSGHSGSAPEHVIVTSSGAGSGHSHESGWHRSMPTHDYSSSQLEQIEEPSHAQDQGYQAYEMETLKRRQSNHQPRPVATIPTRGFL
ncbi:uncharacterized protein LOC111072970 [Drosophila obscura]|uniref:uncharacterized protein LOC111072970 n=1 Tax=Drosophila obscura TaxID=7282 RepID=UPI001BB13D74|nr:uncharacterized protein LOC111072970 [Drosophila obscura]